MKGRLKAWWWIATHPLKSLAIRRFLRNGGEATKAED